MITIPSHIAIIRRFIKGHPSLEQVVGETTKKVVEKFSDDEAAEFYRLSLEVLEAHDEFARTDSDAALDILSDCSNILYQTPISEFIDNVAKTCAH